MAASSFMDFRWEVISRPAGLDLAGEGLAIHRCLDAIEGGPACTGVTAGVRDRQGDPGRHSLLGRVPERAPSAC
ncbi:hypothetical protein [Mesoterricola sediminis]|uniref:hypothetical protein n=1 Tax=Mesoterricola sediminis TaxID=2927980 RepID=UPI00292F03B5|nr:hypothetical protein [Mesoterricola sediminis]